MAKKNFRAVFQERPRYPKASELTQSSLRKLGLAALGGLLFGGTVGMPPARAEEAKNEAKAARTRANQGGVKKGKPTKDAAGAKGPTRGPRIMPNGGKPAPRLVEVDDSPAPARGDVRAPPPKPVPGKPGSQRDGVMTGTGIGAATAPVAPLPTRGEPSVARMPETEKTLPPGKGESTAGKTDSKKQPEFLPPPGAPPLVREPEPAPPPKKSK